MRMVNTSKRYKSNAAITVKNEDDNTSAGNMYMIRTISTAESDIGFFFFPNSNREKIMSDMETHRNDIDAYTGTEFCSEYLVESDQKEASFYFWMERTLMLFLIQLNASHLLLLLYYLTL